MSALSLSPDWEIGYTLFSARHRRDLCKGRCEDFVSLNAHSDEEQHLYSLTSQLPLR